MSRNASASALFWRHLVVAAAVLVKGRAGGFAEEREREYNNGAPGNRTGVTRLRDAALAAPTGPASPGLIYPRSRALLH